VVEGGARRPLSEDPPLTKIRISAWRWSLRFSALLSLAGPVVLVLSFSLSLLPFGLLLAAAFAWSCWSFLSNLQSRLGLARAIGTGLATFPVLLMAAAMGTDGFESDNLWKLFLVGLLVLTPIALVVAAVKCYYAMGREPGDLWTLAEGLGASLIYGVILLVSAAAVLPGSLYSRLASNQAAAVGSIGDIHRCAATYNSRHPDRGFPTDLTDMGPTAEKCIEKQLASGKRRGYVFNYLPAPPGPGTRIGAYTVTARPAKFGTTGTNSFYSDSAHFMTMTPEDRPASPQDSVVAP